MLPGRSGGGLSARGLAVSAHARIVRAGARPAPPRPHRGETRAPLRGAPRAGAAARSREGRTSPRPPEVAGSPRPPGLRRVRQAAAGRAPSSRSRASVRRRRRRPRPGPRRSRASGPNTRGIGPQARPWAPRSARRAARSAAGERRCRKRTAAAPAPHRRRNGVEAGGREACRCHSREQTRTANLRTHGRPPPASPATRCRTSGPEPATCTRVSFGTATARAARAGRGCSPHAGSA